MKAPKFKDYITEEKNKPYRLVILSHNAPDDPNVTGVHFRKEAKKLGIEVFLTEMVGCRIEEKGDKVIVHSFPVDEKGEYEKLLADWGLIAILNKEIAEKKAPLSQIKVLSFKEKGEWDLQAKYNIGKKIEDEGTEV